MTGIFLVMPTLVGSWPFSRGLEVAVPQNPTESKKSTSPIEGVVVL